MIVVKDLYKAFKLAKKQKKEKGNSCADGKVHAVSGVSFECRPGRIFCLLGPNGAGKTTILRMIATLMKPDSGSIEVAGYDTVESAQKVRAHLGFLTGSTKLYDRLTTKELVKYYADLHGMNNTDFNRRRDELFDLLDMNDFADRRIGKLSSGMKQKVSIVRTIIHDPDVVIFDEPTVGLDVITSRSIIDLIRRCKSENKTVIFSTHIMSEVSFLSDDLAVLHEGKLLYNDTYQVFKDRMKTGSLEEEFIRILQEDKS